jgi:S1-C subfamily serine protease
MKKFVLVVVLILFIQTGLFSQEEGKIHHKVYKKVVNSIVAVRAYKVGGEESGTGVILNEQGYILTSSCVVPKEATGIRVWVKGAKLFKAGIVGVLPESEIAIIKIDPKGYKLHPIEFGDSTKVKIGDVAYTVGNAFNTIVDTDQLSFSAGIISGIYKLRKKMGRSTYKGIVFETTAAGNARLEEGPLMLINSEGKLIGVGTLNYSPSRWLANAIPVHVIKYDIDELMKLPPQPYRQIRVGEMPPIEPDELPPLPTQKGYLGIHVKDQQGRIVITKVEDGSPAKNAGLEVGDVIVAMGGQKLSSAEEFIKKLSRLTVGSIVILKVDLGGEGLEQDVRIELTEKPKK